MLFEYEESECVVGVGRVAFRPVLSCNDVRYDA